MKSSYRKYIRLFYASHIAAIVIFLAVTIPVFITTEFTYEIICPLTGVLTIALIIARRILRKKMISTFYADQNAALFQPIVNKRFFGFKLTDKMAIAQCAGDWQTVVNIATSQLKNKKINIYSKYIYLATLILMYFDIRDFEKVKILIEKYDEYLKIYPLNQLPVNRDYFYSFVNHDFDACLEMCAKVQEKIDAEADPSSHLAATNYYYKAIALYENGDVTSAKECFENVISISPSLNYKALIAKKYLDEIENGHSPAIVSEEILPQDDILKKIKCRKTLHTILKVASCCILVCLVVFILANEKDEWTVQYEEKLNTALLKTYDDVEVIDYFWLEKDGETLDNLCLIETDGKLALLSVTTPDNGITFETWVIIDDIIPRSGDCKYGMCVSSENNIKINFSTEKPAVEPLYYSVRFKYKGTKYWFYIDYYKNMLAFD